MEQRSCEYSVQCIALHSGTILSDSKFRSFNSRISSNNIRINSDRIPSIQYSQLEWQRYNACNNIFSRNTFTILTNYKITQKNQKINSAKATPNN